MSEPEWETIPVFLCLEFLSAVEILHSIPSVAGLHGQIGLAEVECAT